MVFCWLSKDVNLCFAKPFTKHRPGLATHPLKKQNRQAPEHHKCSKETNLKVVQLTEICGLYYKHTMIVNYASSIINKLEASLTDDARVVIYDRHVFIVQATAVCLLLQLLDKVLLNLWGIIRSSLFDWWCLNNTYFCHLSS